MTDPAGIPALIDAIRHLHDCEATHVETVHVHERTPDARKTAWRGDVEVFALTGHSKATKAYAWSEATIGFKSGHCQPVCRLDHGLNRFDESGRPVDEGNSPRSPPALHALSPRARDLDGLGHALGARLLTDSLLDPREDVVLSAHGHLREVRAHAGFVEGHREIV